MLDVLQFIFSSFWVFLGTLILASLAVKGIAVVIVGLAAVVRGSGVKIE